MNARYCESRYVHRLASMFRLSWDNTWMWHVCIANVCTYTMYEGCVVFLLKMGAVRILTPKKYISFVISATDVGVPICCCYFPVP